MRLCGNSRVSGKTRVYVEGIFAEVNDDGTYRTHFGDELNLLARYTIGQRSNVLVGCSHVWLGDKILAHRDADFFHKKWEMNFETERNCVKAWEVACVRDAVRRGCGG
jgi:hypothetical protein